MQITSQFEDRVLTGFFTCGVELGELVWRPGLLQQCYSAGKWLILEDIHKASPDVITVIEHFLANEEKMSSKTGKEKESVAEFQIIATCEPDYSGKLHPFLKQMCSGSKGFKCCVLPAIEDNDLKGIVEQRFSNLVDLSTKLLVLKNLLTANQKTVFSLHAFMKFCDDVNNLPKLDAEVICHSAVDYFTAMIPTSQDRLSAAEEIVAVFNFPKENADFLINQYKPALKIEKHTFKIGRSQDVTLKADSQRTKTNYALTKPALLIGENVLLAVQSDLPVLLCGETGTGKTTLVQFLANQVGAEMTVLNMSHQSNSADLIGGLKPVSLSRHFAPIKAKFDNLFAKTFKKDVNEKFLGHVTNAFVKENYRMCLKLILHVSKMVPIKSKMLKAWKEFSAELESLTSYMQRQEKSKESLLFSFVEGCLLQAMKNGHWLLLDEINLASPETLDCLLEVLENRRLTVDEMAGKESVYAHKDFKLFACMNPATDVGKTALPSCVRNHFMEFYFPLTCDEIDLALLASEYLKSSVKIEETQIDNLVKLYIDLINLSKNKVLYDSEEKCANFSLRQFSRALRFISQAKNCSVTKACAEAFKYGFINQLNESSRVKVKERIDKYFPHADKENWLRTSPTAIAIEGFWVEPINSLESLVNEKYVLTSTVKNHLGQLACIVMSGRDPVLLQGETSVGKTSLIHYLADLLGQKVWRINNHEHTDIQEYLGAYCSSKTGELIFEDGVLVKAMKNGNWVILDELNLAPTEVLEALNRLLDDNRELYVPETNKLIKAHPEFMLFGTQNPAGSYSGRKILSRAFRNRFIELNFDQIPEDELKTIISKRCDLPSSYSTKIINLMKSLRSQRSLSNMFAGKSSFITLRDLFRWANRYSNASLSCEQVLFDWNLFLAQQGFMLLAGRARNDIDNNCIRSSIEKTFKVNLKPEEIFKFPSHKSKGVCTPRYLRSLIEMIDEHSDSFEIAWTAKMVRMAILVSNALENKEPVLLVGDTGCGKTTICQLLAQSIDQNLFTVNCNMNSDASDFIGSLRPVRNHESSDIDTDESLESMAASLFKWQDGPVTQAAKTGGILLLDEISLADDSVLERLNSLFEEKRTLLIAENTQDNKIDVIDVHDEFRVVATMNPSGDYGKKELSIALRNRFTEIWCPSDIAREDVLAVVNQLASDFVPEDVCNLCCDFVMMFLEELKISLRDVKSWMQFIKSSTGKIGIQQSFVEGAWLIFLDGLAPKDAIVKKKCIGYLNEQTNYRSFSSDNKVLVPKIEDNFLKIAGFEIEKSENAMDVTNKSSFDFLVPTTNVNLVKTMRALSIKKPILIEGVPGIGKTALVENIAKLTGIDLVRINLSEQTDISDLLGNDLPNLCIDDSQNENETRNPVFSWHDGPLLSAIKSGKWVLLDEINLASQSVLEGLNALFDHRGEVYISELDRIFKLESSTTRFFATQNPSESTNGRKNLPRSFVNRFSKIFMDPLTEKDYRYIFESILKNASDDLKSTMLELVSKSKNVNLRDVLKFSKITEMNKRKLNSELLSYCKDEAFLNFIVGSKLQSTQNEIAKMKINEVDVIPKARNSSKNFRIGKFQLTKNSTSTLKSFSSLSKMENLFCLESIMGCVENAFPALITGQDSNGQVELIKQLAVITGHDVHVINLNSSTDVLDLFGKYSNFDPNALISECCKRIGNVMKKHFRSQQTPRKVADKLLMGLICLETCSNIELFEKFTQILENIQKFSELIFESEIESIQRVVKACSIERKLNNFVWENSVLLDSVQNGHWLILQNVDLCSCAVLDRLNSLLEPGGKLTLGELSSNESGEIQSFSPHEEFRIFLTSSKRIEMENTDAVSSAMYNRCVLINIHSQENNNETVLDKTKPEYLLGFDIYCSKLHSWIQDARCLKKVLKSSSDDVMNSLNLLIEHFPTFENQAEKMKSWKYLEWPDVESLSQDIEALLINRTPDLCWIFLPILDKSSNYFFSSIIKSVSDTFKIISILIKRVCEASSSDGQSLEVFVSKLTKRDDISVEANNAINWEMIQKEFLLSQKLLKWAVFLLNKTSQGVSNHGSYVVSKLSKLMKNFDDNEEKCETSKTSWGKVSKILQVSATRSEVTNLKALFSDKKCIEEPMEIDDMIPSDIRENQETFDAAYWMKLVSLLSCKEILKNNLREQKNLSQAFKLYNLSDVVLELVLKNEEKITKTSNFDIQFTSMLCWAKLWHSEIEMRKQIQDSIETLKRREMFPEPTLENHRSILDDVNQFFCMLWQSSNFLIRTCSSSDQRVNDIVQDISKKLSFQFGGNAVTVESLPAIGRRVFERSLEIMGSFDPAEEAMIKIDCNNAYVESISRYQKLKIMLYNQLLQIEDSSTYVSRHPKLILLEEFQLKVQSRTKDLHSRSFPREPDTERYRSLVNMLMDFDKSILQSSNEVGTQRDVPGTLNGEVIALRNSIFSFIKHLFELFPDFKDVFYLPVTGLCLMLLSIERMEWNSSLTESRNAKLFPELSINSNWIDIFMAETENAEDSFQKLILIIQSFPCYWQSTGSVSSRQLKVFVSKIFSKLWRLWRNHEQKVLEEEETKASGYVYKEKKELLAESIICDEPEILEADSPLSEISKRQPIEEQGSFHEKNYYEVWKSHNELLQCLTANQKCTKPSEISTDLIEKFSNLTKSEVYSLSQTESWLENLMLQVIRFHDKFYRGEQVQDSKLYNIYTDQNISETSKCAPLLKDLKSRVEFLLQEWPEEPNLCSLIKSIDRILYSVPVSQTVVYFAASLEALLAIANSWQVVAARHVSLQNELEPLKNLDMHWRQMELKFWKQSMMYHKQKVYRSVSKFWFNLFALFVQTMNGKNNMEKFIEALFKFLHTSPIGEFEARLDMLASWKNYCNFFGKTEIASIVSNVVDYHKGALARMEKSIEAQVNLLKHDLDSFLKIKSWGSFNLFALKENVIRCKIKIKKVLSNYDEILKQPVADHLILKNENEETSVENASKKKVHSVVFSEVQLKSTQFELVFKASKKFQKKLKIFQTKKVFFNEMTNRLKEDVNEIDDHLKECHKECQELEQTLSNAKNDDEKKAMMSTAKFQMQKRKNLFKSLADYLSDQGLSFKRSLNSSEELSDIMRSVPASISSEDLKSLSSCKDTSMFIAHQYAAFSHMTLSQKSEIDPRMFQICSGFVKDSYNQLCELWSSVNSSLKVCEVVSKFGDLLKPFSLGELSAVQHFVHPANNLVNEVVQDVCNLLDESTKVSLILDQMCREDVTKFLEKCGTSFDSVNKTKHTIDDMINSACWNEMITMTKSESLIRSDAIQATFNRAERALCTLNTQLSDCPEKSNPFILSLVQKSNTCLQNIENFNIELTNSQKEVLSNISEELSSKVKRICVKVINLSQKLHEIAPLDLNEQCEKPASFRVLKSFLDEISSQLKLSSVEKDFYQLKGFLNKSIFDDKNLVLRLKEEKDQLALLSNSVLYLDATLKITLESVGDTFKSLVILIKKCNKIFLELILKGFCVPKEFKEALQSGESKDKGKFEECGIDEGEGVKDVSDQIESEDQLKMEQEQKDGKSKDENGDKKEENKNNDEGSENTPIEMSEDFMADLEDVKLDENEDDSEEDNDNMDSVEDKFGQDDKQNDENSNEEINDEFWNDDDEDDENNEKEENDGKKLENDLKKDGKVDNKEKFNDEPPEDDQKNQSADDKTEPVDENEAQMRADEGNGEDENEQRDQGKDVEAGDDAAETEENDEKDEDIACMDDVKLDGGEDENNEINVDEDEESAEKEIESKDETQDEMENDDETEETTKKDGDKCDEDDAEKEDENSEQGLKDSSVLDEEAENPEEAQKEDPVGTELEPLPNDVVEPQENSHVGTASAVDDKAQDEQQDSAVQSAAARQDENEENDKNAENSSKSESVLTYGNESSGGKRNLTTDQFQTGSKDEEPVQKKGKIEDADLTEMPTNQNKPKEKLEDLAYQHTTDNQKHDVQMFDDAKESADNFFATEDTEIEQIESMDDKIEEKVDEFLEPHEEDVNKNEMSIDTTFAQPNANEKKSLLKDSTETEDNSPEDDAELDDAAGPEKFESSVVSEITSQHPRKDYESLKLSLESICADWSEVVNHLSDHEATMLWSKYSALTSNLSRQLSEQIRIILEPLQSGRLKGDYRSGKRLNMKKLIPYIASGYRKDKIWLRRTKPQKRNYQVMIAIDDSSSMNDGRTRSVAFEAIATLTTALALVEVGQVAVTKFGETCELIHQFNQPFTLNSGANVVRKFAFKQPKTKIAELMKLTTEYMVENRMAASSQPVQDQLQIIVSDGRGLFVEGMFKVPIEFKIKSPKTSFSH